MPQGLWTAHDDPQPLQSMVLSRLVASHPQCTRRQGCLAAREFDRLDLCEGAPLGPRRKRGAKAQAIGPSRGGQTTKIHVVTDLLGRPVTLHLTPGDVSDVTSATELLDQRPPAKAIIADKGYDADRLRSALRAKGTRPVIPGRSNRKKRIHYDEIRYRDRWRIEAAFCRLKDFRRIATRYDRLAANFLSAVALAITIAFWV